MRTYSKYFLSFSFVDQYKCTATSYGDMFCKRANLDEVLFTNFAAEAAFRCQEVFTLKNCSSPQNHPVSVMFPKQGDYFLSQILTALFNPKHEERVYLAVRLI